MTDSELVGAWTTRVLTPTDVEMRVAQDGEAMPYWQRTAMMLEVPLYAAVVWIAGLLSENRPDDEPHDTLASDRVWVAVMGSGSTEAPPSYA